MGGGGLISGIASAIKDTRPSVRVICVELALTSKDYHNQLNKRRTRWPLKNAIADGLRISLPEQYAYPIIECYTDEIVLVVQEEIIQPDQGRETDRRGRCRDRYRQLCWRASSGPGRARGGMVLTSGNWDQCDMAKVYFSA
ncbi:MULTISPECIES: pyridoxal-phosphate dependent enzyme [Pseudomonas]|uniref:pyridoxal-phosphate dependent enzyme n=1 Tax=Pseudomonas TaxID=286 RepID=UPI003905918B